MLSHKASEFKEFIDNAADFVYLRQSELWI